MNKVLSLLTSMRLVPVPVPSQTLLSQHAILSKWMLNTMGGIELLAKEAFESKMLASLNKLKRECSLRR